jgi:ATP-dependent RNA helicase DDX55/SPB4
VYFLTCACVDYFADALAGLPALAGVALTPLHGRMKQSVRERAMELFSAASSGVLLATDVAARGLDIPGVDWVLQVDPPQDPDAFVHRCGRTARMGAAGASLLFLLPAEETYVEFLRRRGVALQAAPEEEEDVVAAGSEAAGALAALRARSERERELMEKARCAALRAWHRYCVRAC